MTDSEEPPVERYDVQNKAGVSNLLDILLRLPARAFRGWTGTSKAKCMVILKVKSQAVSGMLTELSGALSPFP
ncbi:hypothetical protein ACNKHK_21745 [Shigella flexneri]